ncbi:MAG: type II toxin-antitoxin system CcdA family antitoxin [Granulosicoccus sp.]
MGALYKKDAQKKPTNLSINSDLLAKSRKLQINLSALLEAALTEKLAQAENENWQARNKLAIVAYNNMVDEQGCFSDSTRDF